ncbi:hypothetical protein COCON_G00027830 [Conger conger]|uniref:Uncharacterized protein n=1 Tax=Conger conger TaxID=82655 RepID=A0A9Q1I6X5_CONCO|nr:hypothetical protein COCON_G00027830 [Conger conger]
MRKTSRYHMLCSMANSGCLLLSGSGMLPHSLQCPPAFLYLPEAAGRTALSALAPGPTHRARAPCEHTAERLNKHSPFITLRWQQRAPIRSERAAMSHGSTPPPHQSALQRRAAQEFPAKGREVTEGRAILICLGSHVVLWDRPQACSSADLPLPGADQSQSHRISP